MKICGCVFALILAIGLPGIAPCLRARSPAIAGGGRVRFEDSIKEVAANAPASAPRLTRTTLTAQELAAKMDFVVSLRMKNFGELETCIHSGRAVGHAELEARYLPERSDYDRVASWLSSQGFKLTLTDPNHTNVFARGMVAQVSAAFGATFARVATADGEFTSAVTAPSLPAEIAGTVLGIEGLQPHIRFHVPKAKAQAVAMVNGNFTPADISAAYGVPSGLTGAGQTIAIIMGARPIASDLSAFWGDCGISDSYSTYAEIPILGGPTDASQSENSDEVALDIEWATGMAPGAKLRVYETRDLMTSTLLAACTQILADEAADHSITVVSFSAEGPETQYSAGTIMSDSQTFALVADANITFLTGSGDGGSNPDPNTDDNGYSPSYPLTVEYPASDPNVTSVGGTTINLDSDWVDLGETAWTPGAMGTGGGISSFFPRPSWQIGVGLPSGTQRCVPDVAAVSNANTTYATDVGAIIVQDGQTQGQTGTSLAAPVWAGMVAMLNQAREQAGMAPLGLLGPSLYPLLGTSSFTDITSGNNGAYDAGPGYDLSTGIGTPNVGSLAAALTGGAFPLISAQPQSQNASNGGSASFTVAAGGKPAPTFQWEISTDGGSLFAPMADGAGISGSATATLTLTGVESGLSGNEYECVVTNAVGSTTSLPATLGFGSLYIFTTLAGSVYQTGSADGQGGAALFDNPSGLAVDGAGNLFVADYGNNTIRKITPGGTVTTLAGTAGVAGSADGTGTAALFSSPCGVAVDGSENVYVADTVNDTIRKITPAGVVTTIAGSAGQMGIADGSGSAARFFYPNGLKVDGAGNLFVADTYNDTIRRITPAGIVSTLAGTPGQFGSLDGMGAAALFNLPYGLAIDSADNVYVADTYNSTIRKVTPAGVVTTIAGTPNETGSANGTGTSSLFDEPCGIALDGAKNIYVADTGNDTIRKIFPDGTVITVAGAAGDEGSANGIGSTALFFMPFDVALDGTGNLYVVDSGNETVRKGGFVRGPSITTEPESETITVGFNASFEVGAGGSPAPSYQWLVSTDGGATFTVLTDGGGVSGSATGTLNLSAVAPGLNGNQYECVITNTIGSVSTAPATLTVTDLPTFSTEPASQTVNAGSNIVLASAVSGTSGLSYQWYLNGNPIVGATGATLSISNVQTANSGTYTVEASDGFGDVATSNGAMITISQAAASGITTQPMAQTVAGGSTVVFTVAASGSVQTSSLAKTADLSPSDTSGITYQWQFNGANLADGNGVSGSGGPQLMVQGANPADTGDYSCVVTDSGIATQSNAAGLLVVSTPNPGYLINISARANVGTGGNILIGGFYVVGSTSRTVLIQALGPALAGEGVPGALQHPALTIHDSTGATIYSNTGWGSSPILLNAAAAAYANPVLQPGSGDSEALLTLPPGGYTAEISGADGGTGVALCAIYQLP